MRGDAPAAYPTVSGTGRRGRTRAASASTSSAATAMDEPAAAKTTWSPGSHPASRIAGSSASRAASTSASRGWGPSGGEATTPGRPSTARAMSTPVWNPRESRSGTTTARSPGGSVATTSATSGSWTSTKAGSTWTSGTARATSATSAVMTARPSAKRVPCAQAMSVVNAGPPGASGLRADDTRHARDPARRRTNPGARTRRPRGAHRAAQDARASGTVQVNRARYAVGVVPSVRAKF